MDFRMYCSQSVTKLIVDHVLIEGSIYGKAQSFRAPHWLSGGLRVSGAGLHSGSGTCSASVPGPLSAPSPGSVNSRCGQREVHSTNPSPLLDLRERDNI